ncbi:putative cytochrome P450 [Helianthus annuus]|uniref:Cytochrome P450 n=1 Tax=Helianthus annuus TaxID=4232 RepID=A0A9K3E7T0_HELAN|nr:putative cytochrome P450 [Helianthus annuus]KAJ0839826.1 putative cytochrome P450 [Helianthus annuus]
MFSGASSRKQTKMIKVVTPILLLIVLYIFWNVYNNHKTKRSKLNLPPGSFGWPFLGETLALLRANWDGVPERFVQERIEKYGSPLVFKTSLLGERMAVLCGPAGNKFLFANENKLVAMWWPFQVKKLFGRCLLTIRGDEAKWMRKMLLSYLGPDAFASHYAATMDVVTRRHIDVHWRGKEVVNVYQTVKLCSFELSCCLFMSLDKPNQIAKLASLFNTLLKGIIELPINFPGTRFYKSKKAVSSITAELITIIKARRVELEEGKCLAEHPRVYDKVLKEQLDICKAKEAGELLKWEDIQNMRYSSNVVSEVLRLYPATSGTYREALVDIEYAGYTIPKGWKVAALYFYWSKLQCILRIVIKDVRRTQGA